MSITNPSRVYVSSNERDPGQTVTNFTCEIPTPIEEAVSFEIVNFVVPNILYPFTTNNSVLYYRRGGDVADRTFDFSTGSTPITTRQFSDGSQLATYLTTRIQTVDAQLSFTFDGLSAGGTLKLTLVASSGTVAVMAPVDPAGNVRPRFINYKIGYTRINDPSTPYSASDQGDTPINLIPTTCIYVASSLASAESLSTNGRRDILFQIPLSAAFGTLVVYQSTLSGTVFSRPPSSIRSITFQLLDDNFQEVSLPESAVVSAEIHFLFEAQQRSLKTVSIV
jgi:hypothetical protein